MEHLTSGELEVLLSGDSDELSGERQRHLASCDTCAARLAREARLEVALRDALATPADVRPEHAPRPWAVSGWRVALQVAAALAIVAASIHFLLPPKESVPAGARAPTPGLLPSDTPCLVDPRGLGPGHDVISPSEICRDVLPPAEPGRVL